MLMWTLPSTSTDSLSVQGAALGWFAQNGIGVRFAVLVPIAATTWDPGAGSSDESSVTSIKYALLADGSASILTFAGSTVRLDSTASGTTVSSITSSAEGAGAVMVVSIGS